MNTPFEIKYGGRTQEEMAELVKRAALDYLEKGGTK